MAHFAKLDDNNNVLAVHTVNNEDAPNEAAGVSFLTTVTGYSNWKQTSYNTENNTHREGGTPFRGNFAIIGGKYDSTNDIFITQKPFDSWTLNLSTANWEAPVTFPTVLQTAPGDDPDTQISFEWNESQGTYVTNDSTQKWDPNTSSWISI